MQVETYEIEEQVGEDGGTTPEIEDAAIALINELGLDGQQELIVQPTDDLGDDVRIPYPKLAVHEKRVYKVLYPKADSLQSYKEGIIPVRVLQVAAHGSKIFPHLYIWHSKVDPDPLLIGQLNTGYEPDVYLLARWGDALRPFKALAEQARVALLEQWMGKSKRKRLECERFEAAIDANVEDYLGGVYMSTPF
jgi:hypothetical protein